MAQNNEINNSFYDEMGERWYDAYDDPVALLRAENKVKTPWIIERIELENLKQVKVLDVGCGAGFLSNELAHKNYDIVGVDLSTESLKVAQNHDPSGKVRYLIADAYDMPLPDNHFDVLTAMDFLEHVDRPADVIKEFSRVLKPGGLFFFHTFNRNPISHFVVIKLVEWLVKNTPKHMHVIDLFIKPAELERYCHDAGLNVKEMTGIRPVFSSIPLKSLFSGVVPEGLKFRLTKSLQLSYLGVARKVTPIH